MTIVKKEYWKMMVNENGSVSKLLFVLFNNLNYERNHNRFVFVVADKITWIAVWLILDESLCFCCCCFNFLLIELKLNVKSRLFVYLFIVKIMGCYVLNVCVYRVFCYKIPLKMLAYFFLSKLRICSPKIGPPKNSMCWSRFSLNWISCWIW